MKREAPAPPACKVTMQYHAGDSFVYELESKGTAFVVHVSRCAAPDQGNGWMVAAHNGRNAGAVVIAESAPTRTEALRRVGHAWGEKSSELGLPVFDWDAVAAALLSVRAI